MSDPDDTAGGPRCSLMRQLANVGDPNPSVAHQLLVYEQLMNETILEGL